jgi:dolichol-phosphate mannosyltransferase
MQRRPVEAWSKIVVVVPTYNEAANLPVLVQRLFTLGIADLHLLIVDDNSPDGTGALAESLAAQYPHRVEVLHRPHKGGLGTAYIEGFQHALTSGAEAVVQMDADLSHAPEDVPRLLEALAEADVVIGSRYVGKGRVDPRWNVLRRALSRLGNLYARWATGLRVRDATAGFRAFRRRALMGITRVGLRCRGFAFQAEVAYASQRLGYRLVEYPIVFWKRASGTSKMSWQIVWEALWELPGLRWRKGWPPSEAIPA